VARRRLGFTLFELMLVMAVLVIAFCLALPAIQPMISTNDLQAASDSIQSRWTEMRTRAIAEGQPYRFAIQEKTGKFKIAPDTKEHWGSDGKTAEVAGDVPALVVQETLPGKIVFQKYEATCCDSCATGQSLSGGWSHVLTFLPNGQAQEDVQITFGKEGARSLTLVMRGATGTITTVDDKAKETRP
jgi:prepilin-type N-terminal cleavage/methylation domain-containing protein